MDIELPDLSPEEIILAPLIPPVVNAYIAYLEAQAVGRYKSIPQPLRSYLQPHYSINLDNVRFAENIDTVHHQHITIGNHIFFTRPIDLSSCYVEYLNSDIHLLAHELEHCVQYDAVGSMHRFIAKYLVQGALKIIQSQSFNVHDIVELERDAEAKADNIVAGVCRKLNSPIGQCGLRTNKGFFVTAEDGGGREVVAYRRSRGDWETFELFELISSNELNGRVGLRTYNGHFVSAEGGGGAGVVASSRSFGRNESFELKHLGDNKVAFRTWNDYFLSVPNGGGLQWPDLTLPRPGTITIPVPEPEPLVAERSQRGESEEFERVIVPAVAIVDTIDKPKWLEPVLHSVMGA